MSQHDMTVDNAGAATVRVDINSALQALASTSSGATAPTTTFANQFWYDTSTSILKKRNADNDAWINFATFDESGDLVSSMSLADLTVTGDIANSLIRMKPYYYENLGLTLSGGVLTVASADGTALSSSNPGYLCLPSNSTPGALILYTITSNQSMTNTYMNGNLFGLTDSVAFSNSLPLFLYGCSNDNEDAIAFSLSRVPHLKVAPSSSDIGDPSSATADKQYSLYSFTDITETAYDGNACGCLGGLTATKDASNVWTFDTLVKGLDGVGCFHEGRRFEMSPGHFGSDSGNYFSGSGGGTPAVWSNLKYHYFIARSGRCRFHFRGETCSTGGSGSNQLRFHTPFQNADVEKVSYSYGLFMFQDNSGSPTNEYIYGAAGFTQASSNVYFFHIDTPGTSLYQCNSFALNDLSFSISLEYQTANS